MARQQRVQERRGEVWRLRTERKDSCSRLPSRQLATQEASAREERKVSALAVGMGSDIHGLVPPRAMNHLGRGMHTFSFPSLSLPESVGWLSAPRSSCFCDEGPLGTQVI